MRQIIIDTETTGLEPEDGHRIIEIGCVELMDRQITGNNFHRYINPQRQVEEEALAIHGITNAFLQDKPIFADVLNEFLDFINGAELIAHNASFDVGFINYEMRLAAKNSKPLETYVTVFDTLTLARKKFPGQRNTLDAICKRYKIDLSSRQQHGHGALLDAELLAQAYLLMTGGQSDLFTNYGSVIDIKSATNTKISTESNLKKTKSLVIYANDEESLAHKSILKMIKKSSEKCLWLEE